MRVTLLLALLSSCAMAQDDTQKLHRLFDDVYKGVLRENPEAATIFGIPGSNDRWSDLSSEGIARERSMFEGFQSTRSTIHRDRLNATDQLNYDVLGRFLAAQLEQRQFQLYFMLTNQMTGIHLQIANAFERCPKTSVKDYEDILSRMKAVPRLLDQTKAILNQAIAKGITTPKIVLRYLPAQIAAQSPEDPAKSPLMEGFEKMPAAISAADRDRLKSEAARVYRDALAPALRSYRSYLETTYIPKGRDVTPVTEMPNGKEWYAMQVRLMTTTNQTPQQIHELGLSEVKRIRGELEKIQKEVNFNGSFAEFQKYLTTDPKFFYKTPEELLAGYRAVAKRADPEMVRLFNKLPRLPYGVISIPDYEAPASAAHYAPPARDGTRPGYFYANTYLPSGVPKWTMDSLVFHEAVPGHHMQLALAQENPNIPDFRSLWILSAYSEGWGLYAESLGDEIGFYQTPYTRFGKFNSEMFRACRLVVDTGLHALGWSRQQALDYFRENTGGERVSEVDRYIAWPGQALSYKMGELKIKELRAKAEKQLGAKFDLRSFHDVILGNGALPFDLLEQQVDLYLKKVSAQVPGFNYDEDKVAKYTLPDLGVTTLDAWNKVRRPQIEKLLETQMFGRSPGKPQKTSVETTDINKNALGGKAIRKQVTVSITNNGKTAKMDILIYLPAGAKKPVPLFLGLNFGGNHTVNADPGIILSKQLIGPKPDYAPVADATKEKARGRGASQWQVEKILERGYGLATVYYGDIDPDYDDGFQNGVHPLFYKSGQTKPMPDEWASVAAWAWGLSRALDYLESDKDIDARRVAVMGHSRLGKAAAWAGAHDTRFAMVILNESGEGGAALSHRNFGETVARINTSFPHWFCGNYKQYNNNEAALPFDSHMIIALMAPRPVYIASAEGDQWSDPHGEFLGGRNADPVYALFGKKGLGTDEFPGLHQPIMNDIAYHIRAGKHDVTDYDWDQYLGFADKHIK